MSSPMIVKRMEDSRFTEFRQLLESYSLPTEDLEETGILFFQVACEGEVLGYFGLEAYGSMGLLRSLVIHPDRQGSGLGSRTIPLVLTEARKAGMSHLYLLTTDKAGFFSKFGFSIISRDSLPAPIIQTRQFQQLCPESAVSMTILLNED